MMDLRRYPLDEQNCTLEIESCKFKLAKEETAVSLKYWSSTVMLIKSSLTPQLETAHAAELLLIY